MLEEKKRYKAVGIAMFAIAAGLAITRIGSYFLWDVFDKAGLGDVASETLMDTIFTLISQVVVCLAIPLLIYLFYQKRTVKQVLADGNYKKVKWWVPLLCVPMGIGCYFVTWFVVAIWISVLNGFGYVYDPGASAYPEVFNPLLLMLSIFLTGVLPAICEEFAMRGNLVRSLKHTFRGKTIIILAAIAFGLFHQNIVQVFYTALFGALAALLVIKTGSIIPAMVIHFVNNSLSVYMGYDSQYGWGVANFLDKATEQGAFMLFFLAGAAVVAGSTALILWQSKRDRTEIPVLMIYKPTIRESAWYIGAIAIAVCSTFFTFLFGLAI